MSMRRLLLVLALAAARCGSSPDAAERGFPSGYVLEACHDACDGWAETSYWEVDCQSNWAHYEMCGSSGSCWRVRMVCE